MSNRNIVHDFFDLRLSQKREIADWLGIKRLYAREPDFDFYSRVMYEAIIDAALECSTKPDGK